MAICGLNQLNVEQNEALVNKLILYIDSVPIDQCEADQAVK